MNEIGGCYNVVMNEFGGKIPNDSLMFWLNFSRTKKTFLAMMGFLLPSVTS
jgi:hypothetical protein